MGKKRKRVPAALHSELSEYASLLRVLRTNDTLDVVPHLTTPSTFTPVDDDGGEPERPQSATVSPSRAVSLLEDEQDAEKQSSGKSRDTWTRWPLMAGDVHVPEWSFEDEVHLMARQALESQASLRRSATPHVPESPSRETSHVTADDGADAEELLTPSAIRSLTNAASVHLEQMLSTIVSHTPLVEQSMQNRLKPIGWENVLGMMSTSGLVDEKTMRNAQQRLEGIYGPARRPHAERTALVSSSRKALSEAWKQYEFSFLDFPSVPTIGKRGNPVKKRRGPYKNRRHGEHSNSVSVKEESGGSDSSSDSDLPLAKKITEGTPAP